jgi:uncharacterized protein YbjQ (UPF0145 family)
MIAASEVEGLIGALIGIVVMVVMFSPLWLPIVCGVIGTITEKKHYESIHVRERASAHVPVIPTVVSDDSRSVASAVMVTGSTVISPDSFRRFLASIRNIFGGRLRSYESMLDRGRREAILRMKEQAPDADAIVNFRMETSKIGGQQKKQSIIAIEVLAYGTALKYGAGEPPQMPPPL